MTETEKLAQEMNGFFKAIGEVELGIPTQREWKSELEFLRNIKEKYTARLLQKIPKYRSLPPEKIPDMFLMALKKREGELESQKRA